MEKIADWRNIQKIAMDALHKELKPLKVITKQSGSQGAVFKHIQSINHYGQKDPTHEHSMRRTRIGLLRKLKVEDENKVFISFENQDLRAW